MHTTAQESWFPGSEFPFTTESFIAFDLIIDWPAGSQTLFLPGRLFLTGLLLSTPQFVISNILWKHTHNHFQVEGIWDINEAALVGGECFLPVHYCLYSISHPF